MKKNIDKSKTCGCDSDKCVCRTLGQNSHDSESGRCSCNDDSCEPIPQKLKKFPIFEENAMMLDLNNVNCG